MRSRSLDLLRKLKSLESELRDKLSQLKDMDTEIAELVEDEKIDEEVQASCEFVGGVYDCISDVESTIASNKTPAVSGGSMGSPLLGPSTPLSGISSRPNSVHARLPKLELKKFGGNPMEWTPFWDSFQSAVHVNESLNTVDKFNYLKSLIYGQAAETISGFSLTSENYEEAINLLKDRYGNKQVLISAHVESLLKLPAASTISDTKRLRAIYDRIESNVRSLKNIGIASETYGSFLGPVIMAKIPEELRITLTRELPSNDWKLEPMLEIFRKELQLREKCQCTTGPPANSKDIRTKGGHGNQSTTHSLFTDTGEDEQRGPWCTYCRGNHTSASCTVVTQISARKQILRKKGKCFVCLRTGHLAANCMKPKKGCPRCNLNHHISICESKNNSNQVEVPDSSKGNTKDSSKSTSDPPASSGNNQTTSMLINSKNSILLQTARAKVNKPGSDQADANARIIFDSCSQRSYITENLQRALHLPVSGQYTLLIKTFGETSAKLQRCDIVQVAVKTLDGMEVYVSAYVVPTICAPISNQIIQFAQENYPHLHGLELADNVRGSKELAVDLLIGADFYWHFITDVVIRDSTPGPVAIATKLGFVLSGPVEIPACDHQESTVNLTETHVLKISSAVVEENSLDSKIKQFWELESLGIMPNEERVHEKFLENIQFNGKRYEVSLPFKENHEVLHGQLSSKQVKVDVSSTPS